LEILSNYLNSTQFLFKIKIQINFKSDLKLILFFIQMNQDTKISLLMKSLTEFYKEQKYVEQIKSIVDQNSIISLRILDWFITNYSKKFRTIIQKDNGDMMDVYMNYKLMLKSFSKKQFDPFCRKNKIFFYYTDDKFIETSCGQLCFFKWCFENSILDYVKNNLDTIEKDMKTSLKIKRNNKSSNSSNSTNSSDSSESEDFKKKRQPLSISASRSITKQSVKYTLRFD